ncbi:DMT family transporter [Roseiconus nitratireducens]|uniref:DMT family transporter n=1 Tax=Roseiconus nitratireducens TaxID=2605748 RepID=A0A5M6D206_9BACT|nr:DMT family transporter [Roseiconus nitratireducens]KAA5541036.1 DMT family transporter [Roseiconus nitratireducens]
MNWILLSVISAVLLGVYDASKKWSVRDNAVPVVLLISVVIGAALYLPLIVWSHLAPHSVPLRSFAVAPLSWDRHALIMAKSVLVGASWTFAFSALKHLPLSIAAPIRATSPFWTILIAIVFFQERPSPLQWFGMAIVLFGFWQFTLVGRREGIRFASDRAVFLMVAATLLGACSSIYDKWLLQYAGFAPVTMQAWFTVYLVPVMMPLAFRWYRQEREHIPFRWRWSIAVISPLLITADWFYFVALSDPQAMISIVSVLRRCSVVIALVFGARALSEANFRAKAVCVAVILVGVLLLTWHG